MKTRSKFLIVGLPFTLVGASVLSARGRVSITSPSANTVLIFSPTVEAVVTVISPS